MKSGLRASCWLRLSDDVSVATVLRYVSVDFLLETKSELTNKEVGNADLDADHVSEPLK